MTEAIPIELIRLDGGTQIRACHTFQTKVEEYAVAMGEGSQFPPLTVFFDGSDYWLADGFHRLGAYNICMQALKLSGLDVECEVIEGTQRDAILYACGTNAVHGVQRTNSDKQNAVQTMLKNPLVSLNDDGMPWSDRAIAKICKVDHKTVAKWRAEIMTGEIPSQRSYTHNKSGQTTVMNTGGINQDRQQPEAKTPVVVVEPGKPESPAPVVAPETPAAPETKTEPAKGGTVVRFSSVHDYLFDLISTIDKSIAAMPDPATAVADFPEELAHSLPLERALEIQRWWIEFTRLWAARDPEFRRYQDKQRDFIQGEMNVRSH